MTLFAWFNLGSDLVYFDRYEEAALAYDKARELGLPLRMFRYQLAHSLHTSIQAAMTTCLC